MFYLFYIISSHSFSLLLFLQQETLSLLLNPSQNTDFDHTSPGLYTDSIQHKMCLSEKLLKSINRTTVSQSAAKLF